MFWRLWLLKFVRNAAGKIAGPRSWCQNHRSFVWLPRNSSKRRFGLVYFSLFIQISRKGSHATRLVNWRLVFARRYLFASVSLWRGVVDIDLSIRQLECWIMNTNGTQVIGIRWWKCNLLSLSASGFCQRQDNCRSGVEDFSIFTGVGRKGVGMRQRGGGET